MTPLRFCSEICKFQAVDARSKRGSRVEGGVSMSYSTSPEERTRGKESFRGR